MANLEIILRVFIQVHHKSMMSLLQHTKLILEALRKCIVKKLKLLQLFLGPAL